MTTMDDLLLYGVVGWDINALDSVRAIKKAKGKAMSARINSPGGSVWEGLAIATAIREHGDVSTHVDGLAASMGSVLFVSGKTRSMARGSRLMIHNPSSMAAGEADDLRKEADVLDNIADDMAQIGEQYSGQADQQIAALKEQIAQLKGVQEGQQAQIAQAAARHAELVELLRKANEALVRIQSDAALGAAA